MVKNYNSIDVIKFVMALIVVAIHTHPENGIENHLFLRMIKSIYSIAVPFFFVASGFFLYNKLKQLEHTSQLLYLLGWIYRIARLYIIWTIVYLPYAIWGFSKDGMAFSKCIVVYLRNVFFVGENYLSWPLWYLLAMIVVGTIIYFLIKCEIKLYVMAFIALLLALVGIWIDSLHELGVGDIYYKLFKHTRNGLFIGLPFMMIGMLVSNYGCLKKKSLLFLLLFLGFLAKMNNFVIGDYITIYAFFQLVLTINLKDSESYLSFSLASMVIYLVHMIWVGLIFILFPKLSSLLLFLLTILLSILTSCFVLRYKHNNAIKLMFK